MYSRVSNLLTESEIEGRGKQGQGSRFSRQSGETSFVRVGCREHVTRRRVPAFEDGFGQTCRNGLEAQW